MEPLSEIRAQSSFGNCTISSFTHNNKRGGKGSLAKRKERPSNNKKLLAPPIVVRHNKKTMPSSGNLESAKNRRKFLEKGKKCARLGWRVEVREGEGYHTIELFQSGAKRFWEQQKKETRTDADRRGWTQSRAMKTVWLNGPTSLKMSAEQIDPSTWNGWKGKRGRNWLQTGESIYGVDT